jgi:hypothetical protein
VRVGYKKYFFVCGYGMRAWLQEDDPQALSELEKETSQAEKSIAGECG